MALCIVNRPLGDSPIPAGALIWRTCLREVWFAEEAGELSGTEVVDVGIASEQSEASPRERSGERGAAASERVGGRGAAPSNVDGDAYRLLLEILCGLQSPMLGETQVMGQFKSFLSSLAGSAANTHG